MTGQPHPTQQWPTQPWPAQPWPAQPWPSQPWPSQVHAEQPHAAQPWPAQQWPAQAHAARQRSAQPHAARPTMRQPANFPSGQWAPQDGQFPSTQASTGQFPRAQAHVPAAHPAPGPWSPPGQWAGHPMSAPVRPEAPVRRRRGPVAMVSVLLLVLLAAGAAAWMVSSGHAPGTVGASSGSPLAAPRTPNPLPANPLAAAGAGDFCQIARDTVARGSATLNDPNTDLTAMLAEARATNQRLAAAAPAELKSDFAVFQQVSDQMVDALSGGNPQSLQGVATPEFQAAVEHITGYAKTRCGIQLDSLTPPGLGG